MNCQSWATDKCIELFVIRDTQNEDMTSVQEVWHTVRDFKGIEFAKSLLECGGDDEGTFFKLVGGHRLVVVSSNI